MHLSKIITQWSITLLIILAIESIISIYSKDKSVDLERVRFYPPFRNPNFTESLVQWQIGRLWSSRQVPDIMLIGDSSCLFGISPQVMTAITGMVVQNAGTLGYFYTEGHATIMEYMVSEIGAPKVVIYQISPFIISGEREEVRIAWNKNLSQWLGLAPGSGLESFVPSMRLRRSIRWDVHRWGEKMNLVDPLELASEDSLRLSLEKNQGWLSHPKLPPLDINAKKTLRFDPACVSGLRQMVKGAESHGFKLVFVFNPLPSYLKSKIEEQEIIDFEEALREAINNRDYPGVYPMEPLTRFFPDELFATHTHLTENGAFRNSEEIAHFLLNEKIITTKSMEIYE